MIKPLKTKNNLLDAINAIEKSSKRFSIVVDSESTVIGTVTDGDIRRAILSGKSLSIGIKNVMCKSPILAREDSSRKKILEMMLENNIRVVPLIDSQGKFFDLAYFDEIVREKERNKTKKGNFDFAVIIAGGKGSRLMPLTRNIPKPMIKIGDIPLIEKQINHIKKFEITKVYISINYLGHIIESHFEDGRKYGIEIKYLKETYPLGTIGPLSILPNTDSGNILLINGDVLTNANFSNLYDYHIRNGGALTVSAASYNIKIPYGVLIHKNKMITGITEKPQKNYFCNAGIYAIKSNLLAKIPKKTEYNMDDFIKKLINEKEDVILFPMFEKWIDIGSHSSLKKASKMEL